MTVEITQNCLIIFLCLVNRKLLLEVATEQHIRKTARFSIRIQLDNAISKSKSFFFL